MQKKIAPWIVRLVFLAVFAVNMYVAVMFFIHPENYTNLYELSGVSGNYAIAGMGITFAMWNMTYPAVIAAPKKFGAIIAQQIVGLVGESWLLYSLPAGHNNLHQGIAQFIAFDATALALMLTVIIWLRFTTKSNKPANPSHKKS